MAVISDVMRGPYGDIQPDVVITMRAKQTSAKVLVDNRSSVVTDSAGKYSMTVFPGEYTVNVSTLGDVGDIKVFPDSVNGTLNDFLIAPSNPEDLTPEVVKTVDTMRAAAAASAVTAKTNADIAVAAVNDTLNKTTVTAQTVAGSVSFKGGIISYGDQILQATNATAVLFRIRDMAGMEKSAIYCQTDTGVINYRWGGQAYTMQGRADGFISVPKGHLISTALATPEAVADAATSVGNGPISFRGADGAGLDNPNNYSVGTWYGFSVVPTIGTSLAPGVVQGKPVFSVNARTGIAYVLNGLYVRGSSVIAVGDYGFGGNTPVTYSDPTNAGQNMFYRIPANTVGAASNVASAGIMGGYDGGSRWQLGWEQGALKVELATRVRVSAGTWSSWYAMLHAGNTTVDANGFLKKASPIVKLFGDGSCELNAESQGVTIERLSEGVYRVSGVLGFNADGAWGGAGNGIEIPVDDNKRPLVWVESKVLPDGDIEIRTYHRTYDTGPYSARNIEAMDSGEVDKKKRPIFVEMPDGTPIDIPAGRWIDLRVEMPGSDEPECIPEPEPEATPDPIPTEEQPQEPGNSEEPAPGETPAPIPTEEPKE